MDTMGDASDSRSAGENKPTPAFVTPEQREVCWYVDRFGDIGRRTVKRVSRSRVYFTEGYPSFIPLYTAHWSVDAAWNELLDRKDITVKSAQARLDQAKASKQKAYSAAPMSVRNARAKAEGPTHD